MSRTNKHRPNRNTNITLQYMKEELGHKTKCPRKGCRGCMIEVLVRYEDHGPINFEKECTECGKVLKDPRFKRERERRWQQRTGNENFNQPRKDSGDAPKRQNQRRSRQQVRCLSK